MGKESVLAKNKNRAPKPDPKIEKPPETYLDAIGYTDEDMRSLEQYLKNTIAEQ